MVEKNVLICDDCGRQIAYKKCSLCKKDICEGCGEEVTVGTISLSLCNSCSRKAESVIDYEDFWKEFNKNENMKEKIMEYINKNLILKGLEDEEDDEYSSSVRKGKLKRRKKTSRRRIMR